MSHTREELRRLAVLAAAGLLVHVLSVACSAAQPVAQDVSCSPKADAVYAAELELKCAGKYVAECPEAKAIGNRYEVEAEAECAR